MLRKLSYIIQICYLLLLCSCNIKDTHPISIGFSQSISESDVWRKSMDHAMEVEASLHPDVKLTIYISDRNVKKQIQHIDKMINQGVDVIIISPYESDSIVPVIEKANQRGIPVIIVDRKVNTTNYTAFLGADNVEVGMIAAKQIVSLSKGHANVVEITGESVTTPGTERSFGFKQIIDQYSGIHRISINNDDFNSPSSKYVKILDSLPNIDYVFAFNDIIAYNAWKIAKKKKPNNHIKFIGVDGLNGPNGGLQLVKDGVLDGTVLYPTGGAEAIKLALRIANKEIVPKNNKLSTTLIDSLNAEIMGSQFDKISLQQSDIEKQQNFISEQEEKYSSQRNLLRISITLSILLFLFAVHSIYSRIVISRKKKELEQTNEKVISQKNEIEKFAEEIKQNNEVRLNFFMGISHEFKTPLTLILGSIQSLTDELKNKGVTINNELNLMYNNSRRLLRLINQLLDFRKIENDKFILRASKTNLFEFTKSIINDFNREAKSRNIEFTLTTNNEELEIFIDRNLMDKVYFNLLSNAFKFTPTNGKISITITEDKINNSVKISFKDSGIGIPENEIEEVFKPFYQGSNNYKNSSGIGLYLTKKLVELHHGTIEIVSKIGSELLIKLFLGKEHLQNEIIVDESDLNLVYQTDYLDLQVFPKKEPKNNEDNYTLLYIEDNKELVEFISNKLAVDYLVHTSDGTNPIEIAMEIVPDIIICDLNLPNKNGFQISEILKKDLRTSHIPIIILTASDDPDSYLKALESGADIFLTKPFDLKVLLQSIKSLLFNRERLHYYYSNNIDNIVKNDEVRFDVSEQNFLRKLNEYINQNIYQSDYTVEDLASDLNISRVQLYRKVKAILGISVSDYINNIRLEKSTELLLSTKQNISEIAFSIGFSSPYYFSNVFKKKYGISPKDFRSQNSKIK
ncbi:substrate-binding domain-containing protein [Flavobacterium cellulosilyticum]|uniref:histidine kinase n=1 Tax=Flavobacterium cellulosilyticum TaxID=2541731 RepID=A0A4R5CP44_9FLAO|nr:substrate-binding domain-containing protein [Flavobacterium cellulosilyticum]TDD99364.1 helix-turn-helix domain-containing protein [Flavobacterium cellulosilyticum]